MKTLVIGHTSDIGKALCEMIESDGISRSTGFDLNDIESSDVNFADYDCVILNAYAEFTSQLRALYYIAEQLGKNKLLVVMASNAAYRSNQKDPSRSKYSVEKAALIKAARDMNELGYNISCISPGVVDTQWNKNKTVNKLSTYDVANVVKKAIDDFQSNGVLIEHVVFLPRNIK